MEDRMKFRQSVLVLLLVTAAILSACSAGGPTLEAMVEEEAPTPEIIVEEKSPSPEAMMEEEEPSAEVMMEEVVPSAEEAMEEEIEEPAPEATGEREEPTVEAMLDEESDMAETMDEPDIPEASTAEPMVEEEAAPAEAMADEAKMVSETWYGVALVDVNTGDTFKVADLRGKVVLVETMAVWCTTCLRQQRQVQALHEKLGEREDLVSLALDIDPNETPEILKVHADRNGFDWHYAVAPIEVAREIDRLYGTQFLNPPSAPMFIIDGHGEVHPLPFGVKSAQVLQEALEPHLN
jgi:thiol-disulfide isomerase/thioredoxin